MMKMFKRGDTEKKKKPIDLVDIYEENQERDPTTRTGYNNKIEKVKTIIIKPKSLHLSSIYTGDPGKTNVTSTLSRYSLGQFLRRKIDHEEDNTAGNASGNASGNRK